MAEFCWLEDGDNQTIFIRLSSSMIDSLSLKEGILF